MKYPRIDGRAAENFVSLQEIVLAARRNLPQALWDHLSGGADSETTLARNRQALDSLALRQRVLVDVREVDITTTLLGRKLASPVFLAPVGGFVGFVHPEGACNIARAAVARGTTAFISTAAKPSLEAAAAAGEAGLVRMLELLELEIRTALGLMGVTSLGQLGPSWVRPAQPVRPASQTNGYPWFEEQMRK